MHCAELEQHGGASQHVHTILEFEDVINLLLDGTKSYQ